jgi:hypothetical protein
MRIVPLEAVLMRRETTLPGVPTWRTAKTGTAIMPGVEAPPHDEQPAPTAASDRDANISAAKSRAQIVCRGLAGRAAKERAKVGTWNVFMSRKIRREEG